MGIVAVVCLAENHTYRLVRLNLEKQGWIVFKATNGLEALEHVRQQGASCLVMDDQGIWPSTSADIAVELSRDPGDDRVKVINLDVKSPAPPAIFGNPKGPLPPAVAIRPLEWIAKAGRR